MSRDISSRRNLVVRCGLAVAVLPLLLAAPLSTAVAQRSAYEELQVFSGVLNHIRNNYVDSVSYSSLVRAAIDGMLKSLDPHSRYIPAYAWQRMIDLTEGKIGAVGVTLENVEDQPTVVSVVPESPAARKGIQPGDRLYSINDTVVAGLSIPELEARLVARKGTKYKLILERGPRLEPHQYFVSLKADNLKRHDVTIVRMVDEETGYLKLAEFNEKAGEEVKKAIGRLKKSHARRVILDLRGNPGGLVVSAVEVASLFFPKKTVVFKTQSSRKHMEEVFVTEKNGKFRELPLVVLIDERTASAAEALAASLQDHDRALLLGRRSFGKALMQAPFFLPGGDVLMLTMGHVITPSGRFIQRRYRGLRAAQYYAFAGKGGAAADTAQVFRTDGGREVRGGGGIEPDEALPGRAELPVWWSAAADSGYYEAVADSVAYTLPETREALAAWIHDEARWARMTGVFLEHVRNSLHVTAAIETEVRARIGRLLGLRAAEVRWGPDAREEFLLANDSDVGKALEYFPKLPEILGHQSD